MDHFTRVNWDEYPLDQNDGMMSSANYPNPANETETRQQLQSQHTQLQNYVTDVMVPYIEDLVTEGGEPNVINHIMVNNVEAVPVNKVVNISIPVDQTYDATSVNAQSGVAVASAISSVLPGTMTTIATGDRLMFSDSSDSDKVKKSNITFGTETTSFLCRDGTWKTPQSVTYIDPDNLLANGTTLTSESPYTATQECYMNLIVNYYGTGGGYVKMKKSGGSATTIMRVDSGKPGINCFLHLKKGDKIWLTDSYTGQRYYVFGARS